jgi:hypothetical protein
VLLLILKNDVWGRKGSIMLALHETKSVDSETTVFG